MTARPRPARAASRNGSESFALKITRARCAASGHHSKPGFFSALAENLEFSAFEPQELIEGPNVVVARVHMIFRVKATGRVVDQSQIHWWTFDGSKVSSIVHFEDTAQVSAAVAR